MNYRMKCDVLVVGAGHAGCEAACAAANMGAKTLLLTSDMNRVGQMSCNPAIGGIAKGQIAREVDALGGYMGVVTDLSTIQFRMLNRSKGPAVWSPRAQCDREQYIKQWREVLDNTNNLSIYQDTATQLIVENNEVKGVKTIWGVEIQAKSVIVTAGTFLNGLMHVGKNTVEGGRMAEPAVKMFTESITVHGIKSGRMKTGTPVRIDKRSVDFSLTELQYGEEGTDKMSYLNTKQPLKQQPCYIFYTNKEAHNVLNNSIDQSPLYNGQINSIGPRYCPSIETKLVTFPEREMHMLFLEPEGENTNEMYLNGFSSSLPTSIQLEALRQIPALKNVEIYRPGYAIEYDFFDPSQLNHTLESKILNGLFFAGQVNGTTGYEEAAGQGIVAGINAAIKCGGGKPFIMHRDESYIGVLIDDLVNKGVDEPYRMFTSRAEYRILLRQDNADTRLTETAYNLGTATKNRYDWYKEKQENINRIVDFCNETSIKPKEINSALESIGSTPLRYSCKIKDLIARPQVTLNNIVEHIPQLKNIINDLQNRTEEIVTCAETEIKYKGYIERERIAANKMHRLEDIKIKNVFKYETITQLSTEARQKLTKVNPETLAQASRIPGVSPNDISVLLVLMKR